MGDRFGDFRTVEKNAEDFGTQLIDKAVANPWNGVAELVDNVPGVHLPEWHHEVGESASSIGGKVGALAGGLATLTALSLTSKAGFEAAGVSTRSLAGSALTLGSAGAVYGGIFTPIDSAGSSSGYGSNLYARLKMASIDGLSMAALGATNAAFEGLPLNYRMGASVGANAAIGAATEFAYEPLINHRAASPESVAKQAATYGLLAGLFTAIDHAPARTTETSAYGRPITEQPIELAGARPLPLESESPARLPSIETSDPVAEVRRLSDEPLITPKPGTQYSAGAFNPTLIRTDDGLYHILFRGQDDAGISRIFYAQSKDGLHYQVEDEPVLGPSTGADARGVEDPRVFRNPDNSKEFWLTATAYGDGGIQLGLWKSTDLRNWQPAEVNNPVIVPLISGIREGQTKAGNLLPERINGDLGMYLMRDYKSGSDQMAFFTSPDGRSWTEQPGPRPANSPDAENESPVLPRRPGMFDERVVEPGPPPVKTEQGWLQFYNGGDNNLTYKMGWSLFDLKDPTKLLARSDKPMLEPELPWEKHTAAQGKIYQAPNVVFGEGMVPYGDGHLMVYGAADSYIGGAQVRLAKPTSGGR